MTAPNELKRAVFVDRDGTVMTDVNYCRRPDDVAVFDGAGEALLRLKQSGFKVIVVTNQSGIGRGYFSDDDYHAVHAEFVRQLGEDVIDAAYYCPDVPNIGSSRRKPSPGMVLEAQREHGLDLSRSFFVGDKPLDVECGRAAGTRTILIEDGSGRAGACAPDWVARDLQQAADLILEHADD